MNHFEPPPATPTRRWWKHWLFKTLILTIAVVAACYIIEKWIGERAWKAYQKDAVAAGKKLRLEDYVPPPIPDAENYAAAPIFQTLFSTYGQRKKTEDSLKLPELPRFGPKKTDPDSLDLTKWQQIFIKARWISKSQGEPSADVLAALERVEGPLSQIRMAALRPKCRWPINWSDGMGAKFHQIETLRAATQCFALRARALLASGRPEEALAELRQIVRIDQSLSQEPTLLPLLVRCSAWSTALDVCEQGIGTNQWKPAQLQTIAKEPGAINFLRAWKFALNSERGMGNHAFEQLAASPGRGLAGLTSGPSGKPSTESNLIWSAIPRGWIRWNQIDYNELIDRDVADIGFDVERIGPRYCSSEAVLKQRFSSVAGRFQYLITNMIVPVTSQVANRAFESHSRLQQTRIHCAIALYRQATGETPPSLENLVPAYLEAIPHDIMDGNPMRYRRSENGSVAVWSIGINRVDDGGARGQTKGSRSKALDWVVEIPPVSR